MESQVGGSHAEIETGTYNTFALKAQKIATPLMTIAILFGLISFFYSYLQNNGSKLIWNSEECNDAKYGLIEI